MIVIDVIIMQEMVSSPKLANKSSKDVLEATPKTNPKRKRTPAKEKVGIHKCGLCAFTLCFL